MMKRLEPWLRDYGMVGILLALCVFFSFATLDLQKPVGADAARQIAQQAAEYAKGNPSQKYLLVADAGPDAKEFLDELQRRLPKDSVWKTAEGSPGNAREALDEVSQSEKIPIDAILCNGTASEWTLFEDLEGRFPKLKGMSVLIPKEYRWPNFLKQSNLINIANQIAVIAVLAIGMTMVIITGGIDLSVGSLIALSCVIATRLIRDYAGGEQASSLALVVCSLLAIAKCGGIGWLTGMFILRGRIPPFIATLSMMLVASGFAYTLSKGESIAALPDQAVWLGRGVTLGLPNAVWLMLALYTIAHLIMTYFTFGRHVYAVGGNVKAARLSGIPVGRVIVTVYVISGLLAGLGGVMVASQLKSGSATYGNMYELYVIASVVVGGTSLSGGEGKIFGTLVGALIIAVIQNGMNLTGVEAYTQKIVLGLVILVAVLLDRRRRELA